MSLSKSKRARMRYRERSRAAEPFARLLDANRDHAVRRFVEAGEVDRLYLPRELVQWADEHPGKVRPRLDAEA